MPSGSPEPEPLAPFHYVRHGRSLRTGLTLLTIWACFLALFVLLDAHVVIVACLFATTLPALWDFAQDRQATLSLDETGLHWRSGSIETHLPYDQIAAIRLDTRLDLSVRLTCLTTDAQRVRAPIEATPPGEALETALKARNIPVTRHHFALSG